MAHLAYLKSDNNINGEKAALFFYQATFTIQKQI